jgi:hypothetical protein
MKLPAYLLGGVMLCLLLIVILFFRVFNLENRLRSFGDTDGAAITALQKSLKLVQAELALQRNCTGTGRIHDHDPIARRETLVRRQGCELAASGIRA